MAVRPELAGVASPTGGDGAAPARRPPLDFVLLLLAHGNRLLLAEEEHLALGRAVAERAADLISR